jgi:hypothetical protein
MAASTAPDLLIWTHETPPTLMFGVSAQALSRCVSAGSAHDCVVITTARFGPVTGVKSSVTTRLLGSLPSPGDVPSQMVGRTCSSTKSPGPAKGRSSVPIAPRKIG